MVNFSWTKRGPYKRAPVWSTFDWFMGGCGCPFILTSAASAHLHAGHLLRLAPVVRPLPQLYVLVMVGFPPHLFVVSVAIWLPRLWCGWWLMKYVFHGSQGNFLSIKTLINGTLRESKKVKSESTLYQVPGCPNPQRGPWPHSWWGRRPWNPSCGKWWSSCCASACCHRGGSPWSLTLPRRSCSPAGSRCTWGARPAPSSTRTP